MEEANKAAKDFLDWVVGSGTAGVVVSIKSTYVRLALTFLGGVAFSAIVTAYLSNRSARARKEASSSSSDGPERDEGTKPSLRLARAGLGRADFSVLRQRKKSKIAVHALARARHGGAAFVPSESCCTHLHPLEAKILEEAAMGTDGSDSSDSSEDGGEEKKKSGAAAAANINANINRRASVDLENMELQDRAVIESAMDCFVFSALSPAEKHKLVEYLEEPVGYGAGEVIVREGDEGDYYYIIQEGTVGVSISKKTDENTKVQQQGRNKSSQKSSIATSLARQLAMTKAHSARCKEVLFLDRPRECSESDSVKRSKSIQSSQRHSVMPRPAADGEQNFAPAVVTKELTRGDAFGELALLYNCKRSATCTATTPCSLWRISRSAFRSVMSEAYDLSKVSSQQEIMTSKISDTLKRTPIGKQMSDATLRQLASTFLPVSYRRGEVILRKGDVGNTFFVVLTGTVSIRDIGSGDAQFATATAGPGDYFGERSLITNEPRNATIVAQSDVVQVSALCRAQFEAKFGSLTSLIEHEAKKRQIATIPSFARSSLDDDEIDKLIKASTTVTFKSSAEIAKVGAKVVPALYLIESGRVEIISEKKNAVNTLTKGCYFGGETLLSRNNKNVSSSDLCSSEQYIRAAEDTVCSVLTLATIESVIGDLSRLGKPLPLVSAKLDRTLKLCNLKKHCILGAGAFGKVWLVQHKTKKDRILALKVLNKTTVLSSSADVYVVREKNIMASIDHPLIVNLVAAFQDESSLYMAMNFIQGGELYTRIWNAWEEADGLTEWDAKFYGACIFESLSHLHRRSILFRDLKPENVLIDKSGYCVLIDLGFAKVVLDRTHTICGTPEYFSPELILGKPYNRGVDDWAFGSVLYEMLVGQSPFMQENMSEQALFKRIVKNRWSFPDDVSISQEAQDLVKSLLEKDPTKRLGQHTSADEEIRRHPWFEGLLHGNKLLQRSVKAPWLPSVNDPLDTSHFEEFSSLEKSLEDAEDEAPPADQQHLFRGFSRQYPECTPTVSAVGHSSRAA